jgi:hypothetical protein
MTARAWIITTIAFTLALLAAIASVDAAIDLFGIFRNPAGRRLQGYGDDRVAKYLLSERYVPANFNSIVVGSSVSANWNTGQIDCFKVYNESINGANVVEEKTIADQALTSSRIKLAILVVHPFLTSSHEFETVKVTPRENLAALGSLNLLDAYKEKIHSDLYHGGGTFDEFGTYDLGDAHREMNLVLKKLMATQGNFNVDPIALKAERDLIAELRGANIPIVYVVPPLSQSLYESKADSFAAYSRLILGNKLDRENIIDFTSPEFQAFRQDGGNFSDGVHLTVRGARQIVAEINRQLCDWTRTGQLSGTAK